MRPETKRSGFTLVELLVVIGIITVLISILLPALNKVRAAGKGAQCLSNLRQVMNGMLIYAAQNHGNFAITSQSANDPSGVGEIVFSNPNDVSPLLTQRCPAILDYVDASDPLASNSYSWNPWLAYAQNPAPNYGPFSITYGPSVPINPGKCPDPAEVILYGDSVDTNSSGISSTNGQGLQDSFFSVLQPPSPPTLTLARPTFQGRHNGRGSILWMDGHASLEAPVLIPGSYTVTVNQSNTSGFRKPASFYNYYQIGYLVRSPSDVATMAALYYFVYDKDGLSTHTLADYLNSSKAMWK